MDQAKIDQPWGGSEWAGSHTSLQGGRVGVCLVMGQNLPKNKGFSGLLAPRRQCQCLSRVPTQFCPITRLEGVGSGGLECLPAVCSPPVFSDHPSNQRRFNEQGRPEVCWIVALYINSVNERYKAIGTGKNDVLLFIWLGMDNNHSPLTGQLGELFALLRMVCGVAWMLLSVGFLSLWS